VKKGDLSPEALADRDAFVALLADEGWDIAPEEPLFQAGVDVNPEASADKRAGKYRQRLWFDAKDRTVWWHFEDDGDLRFVFQMRPIESIVHVVAAVLTAQDLLAADRVGEAVKLMTLVAEVHVQTENGPMRVRPAKAAP
jgi:hypothetical protein